MLSMNIKQIKRCLFYHRNRTGFSIYFTDTSVSCQFPADNNLSMEIAQNILVIKTVAGMANAAGAALDNMKMNEIVGCIAGDDTIACINRTVDDTIILMEKIKKIINTGEESTR